VSFDGTLRCYAPGAATPRHSYASFSRRRYYLFCQCTSRKNRNKGSIFAVAFFLTTRLMIKHFLIAEDDEDDIAMYKDAIANIALPIEVTLVIYCEGIFKSIAVEPLPDLIIVDGNLPGKSLLQCITEIRSHEKLCNHPLVVLTGSGSVKQL
jgi:CheY-like chemotaxis protein